MVHASLLTHPYRPCFVPPCSYGANLFGQATIPSLVDVDGNPITEWLQVSAGANHTCAIDLYNDLHCWGSNAYSQTTVPNSNQDWVYVSAGAKHTCACMLCRVQPRSTLAACLLEAPCSSHASPGSTQPPACAPTGGILEDSSVDPPARTVACFGDNTYNQLAVPAGGAITSWYTVSAGDTYNCAWGRLCMSHAEHAGCCNSSLDSMSHPPHLYCRRCDQRRRLVLLGRCLSGRNQPPRDWLQLGPGCYRPRLCLRH